MQIMAFGSLSTIGFPIKIGGDSMKSKCFYTTMLKRINTASEPIWREQ